LFELAVSVYNGFMNNKFNDINGNEIKLEDISKFFFKSELVPTIVQEANTQEVLMLAYMNEESLRKTLETGWTWYFSRSRQRLWQKGEESGHVQKVVSITGDCDDDTLLVKVEQTGPACHTGNRTCFYAPPIFKG
jgi:phosphoribosyl-AMP cyclohydrolase/phosphoribosyl-ATP pyrophosphohydrolase/phosphoribosyl-AMP cyclohydrolase